MALSELALSHFRNHIDTRLTGLARFVVLTGDNGAGKTNVLEAVSLLAPGRGLRRAALPVIAAQQGPGDFAVSALIADQGVRIGTGIEAAQPGRRIVRVNGAAASAHSLADWLAIVWLTPAMDRMFMEAAGGRRRFLDRLVLALDPGHARHAARYEAALSERNRLLAGDRIADPAWLDALEARLGEHGAALVQARRETVAQLNTALGSGELGLFARPLLALQPHDLPDDPDRLAALLRRQRDRDRAAGRALAGPHRTDLVVTMRQTGQAAALCSTGEQKAMLIAIMLAHADLVAARAPGRLILLLDEIAAHLDPVRRAALYEQLAARAGQVWMTGTDAALFEGIAAGLRSDLHIVAGHAR